MITLFLSQKFSYRVDLPGAYTQTKVCVRDIVGLPPGAYTIGRGSLYAEKYGMFSSNDVEQQYTQ